jgi:cytoskeletal protein CcmA (bactofilin family)
MRAQRFFLLSGIVVGLGIGLDACRPGGEPGTAHDKTTTILPAGEVHEGWYFAGGDHIVINGTVNGDAYIAGGMVEVNGTINGDLLAAGGNVRVGGKITDDARVAGGTVEISGEVGKNVTAAGGTVSLGKSGTVGGGLLAAGGRVDVSGTVKKDAVLGCGTAEITGTINGNVRIGADQIGVYRGAMIAGSLSVASDSEEKVHVEDGTVKGPVTFEEHKVHQGATILGYSPFRFWLKLSWIGGLLLTGLVFFLLSRKRFADYTKTVKRQAGMGLLWGLVGVIGIPIVCTILFVTVIGLPLGLILLALYLILLYLSQFSLGVLAGDLIFKTEQKSGWIVFWAFVAGMVLFQILSFIPILGVLLEVAALLLGVGAIILMIRKAYGPARAMTAPS